LRVESERKVIDRDRYNSGSKKNLKKTYSGQKNKIKDKKITVVVGVKY
jgi:hypothetical protein